MTEWPPHFLVHSPILLELIFPMHSKFFLLFRVKCIALATKCLAVIASWRSVRGRNKTPAIFLWTSLSVITSLFRIVVFMSVAFHKKRPKRNLFKVNLENILKMTKWSSIKWRFLAKSMHAI